MNGSVPPLLVYYVAWCCSICATDMGVLLFLWQVGLSSGQGVPELLPNPSLFVLLPSISHYFRALYPALTIYIYIPFNFGYRCFGLYRYTLT
jgi:hypothetical protein